MNVSTNPVKPAKRIETYSNDLISLTLPIFARNAKELETDPTKSLDDIGTIADRYAKQYFKHFSILDECIHLLKSTETYLSIQEVPSHYLTNGIEQYDYYRHHVEFFLVKCASTIDLCSKLINHGLALGLPNKSCGSQAISENTIWGKSQPAIRLKNFDNEFQSLKKERNFIVHHGGFNHDKLSDLEGFISGATYAKEYHPEITLFDKGKAETISKIISEFNYKIERIEFHVAEILDALDIEFKKHYQYLKSLS